MVIAAIPAHAADIETLVMPGPLTQAHAEYESACRQCHTPFRKSEQDRLCRDCHEPIDQDMSAGHGFHGKSDDVQAARCIACHTEHEGRSADIVALDIERFDHKLTDFHLRDSHREVACADCHDATSAWRDAPGACIDCHRKDDAHEGQLGETCEDCHRETQWSDAPFDHDTTGYQLIGGHRDAACLDCHADHTFTRTPTQCEGCHRADDVHDGRHGLACESCHSPHDWQVVSFDHNRDTDFRLLGAHDGLACEECHQQDPYTHALATDCYSCHRDDDAHQGHFAEMCEQCHSVEAWAPAEFDHEQASGYALQGEHAQAVCEACHVEPVFEVALKPDCYACHAADDVHDGTQGKQCERCHNERDWASDVLFDHDLTRFPLLGNHAEVACDDCHRSQVFSEADTACDACHRAEDPHGETQANRCELCHNPAGWDFWFFDHDTQTQFALDGAHSALACEQCHNQPIERFAARTKRWACTQCHARDDVHDGEFGSDCARCHTTRAFEELHDVR